MPNVLELTQNSTCQRGAEKESQGYDYVGAARKRVGRENLARAATSSHRRRMVNIVREVKRYLSQDWLLGIPATAKG